MEFAIFDSKEFDSREAITKISLQAVPVLFKTIIIKPRTWLSKCKPVSGNEAAGGMWNRGISWGEGAGCIGELRRCKLGAPSK